MFRYTLGAIAIVMAMTLQAQTQGIDPEKKWHTVMHAIELVESEGRADAVSKNGKYVGCLQISEILVRQCNQIAGCQRFSYNDRYDKRKSYDMFILFQEYFNPEGNVEKAIRLWNSGDLQCMNRKARTEAYYKRVMAQYRQLAAAH